MSSPEKSTLRPYPSDRAQVGDARWVDCWNEGRWKETLTPPVIPHPDSSLCKVCGEEPAFENGVCRWESCEDAAD